MAEQEQGGEDWAARLRSSLGKAPASEGAAAPPPAGGLLSTLGGPPAPEGGPAGNLLGSPRSTAQPPAPSEGVGGPGGGPPLTGLLQALATPPSGLLRPEGLPARAGAAVALPPVAPSHARQAEAAAAQRQSLDDLLAEPDGERILAALSLPRAAGPMAAKAAPPATPRPPVRPAVAARPAVPRMNAALANWEPAFDPEDLAALDRFQGDGRAEAGMVVDWFGLRTPGSIAPELRARFGTVLRRPIPIDPRTPGADWAGLVRSLVSATTAWRGFSFGAGRGDVLLAGAVAARQSGLAVQVHATEPNPGRFAALLRHAEANGIAGAEARFLQVEVGTDPANPPPRGGTVQELLAEGPGWDWVRIGSHATVSGLVPKHLPLLARRVRVLTLVTAGRVEEARLFEGMSEAGWSLIAEAACGAARADPRQIARPGVQAWLSPGA
jgi:hypothetical protein